MSLADQWEFLAALPYLAAAVGIGYITVAALGSRPRGLRRKEKQRQRRSESPTPDLKPWDEWLRDINERHSRTRIDDFR
jgi:hypothetical protein